MAKMPEIVISLTGVEINGRSVPYDAVDAVGYLRQIRRASGLVTDVIRSFDLYVAGEKLAVKLDGAQVLKEEKNAAWKKLVAASQTSIEPRLRREALQRIEGGEPVVIGRIQLTGAGFAWRGPLRPKQFSWAAYERAYYENCRIKVLAAGTTEQPVRVGELDTDTANAVLLPRLMPACVAAFPPGP